MPHPRSDPTLKAVQDCHEVSESMGGAPAPRRAGMAEGRGAHFFALLVFTLASILSLPAQADSACTSRPGQGPEMVMIPAGRFLMGSPAGEQGRNNDEGPRHPVAIVRPFALMRCEVTVGEFRAFVEESGYRTEAETNGKGCVTWDEAVKKFQYVAEASWRVPRFPAGAAQGDRHPVVCVSWNDARAYAAWLSLRTGRNYHLPTEAEWEYAARAGTTTPFSTGDCITTDQANYNGNSDFNGCGAKTGVHRQQTLPVAELPPNPWGLQHIHGNVWEWTQDCLHGDYRQAPADGSAWEEEAGGDCSLRVVHGGGWDDRPVDLRSAFRSWVAPVDALNDLGFRLARTP